MSLLIQENTPFESDDDAAQVAATASAAQQASAQAAASQASADKAQADVAKAETAATAAQPQPTQAKAAATAAQPEPTQAVSLMAAGGGTGNLTVAGETALAMRETKRQLMGYKDALPVDYDTLDQIIASNGNFMDRETKKTLGDTVIFEYLSFQDAFVVSPEDDKAPKEHVRYSKDGIVCSDGTMVQDHLDWLKNNGYPKARLKQRVVVVGAIETASKTQDFNGKLVQFDLSPKSRTMWNRFQAQAAYALATKKLEKIGRVKAETQIKSAGTETFTVATFNFA